MDGNTKPLPGKGETRCNRTACQVELDAGKWWNQSTLAWYCHDCAVAINRTNEFCCVPPCNMPRATAPQAGSASVIQPNGPSADMSDCSSQRDGMRPAASAKEGTDTLSGPDIGKFQDAIRAALIDGVRAITGKDYAHRIDGGGCDSGDWRDFTVAEIRSAFMAIEHHNELAKIPGSGETIGEVVARSVMRAVKIAELTAELRDLRQAVPASGVTEAMANAGAIALEQEVRLTHAMAHVKGRTVASMPTPDDIASARRLALVAIEASLAAAPKREAWIACSERLPPPGARIAVSSRDGSVSGATYHGCGNWYVNGFLAFNDSLPTHWQPLPEPPAAKATSGEGTT